MDDINESNDSDCGSIASHKIKKATKKYNKDDFIKTKALKPKKKSIKHKTNMKDINTGKNHPNVQNKLKWNWKKTRQWQIMKNFLVFLLWKCYMIKVK